MTYPANPWAGAKLRGVDIENLHKELVEARSGEKATEILESFINQVAESDDVDKKRSNPKVDLLKLKLEKDGISQTYSRGYSRVSHLTTLYAEV